MCFELPDQVFKMAPWATHQIDGVLDQFLLMLDMDKADELHWESVQTDKAAKLKPLQKKTGRIIRERQLSLRERLAKMSISR